MANLPDCAPKDMLCFPILHICVGFTLKVKHSKLSGSTYYSGTMQIKMQITASGGLILSHKFPFTKIGIMVTMLG